MNAKDFEKLGLDFDKEIDRHIEILIDVSEGRRPKEDVSGAITWLANQKLKSPELDLALIKNQGF